MGRHSETRVSGPTRREALGALLGAPFLLLGCGSGRKVPPLPEGRVVGGSDAFGHLLQSQQRLAPSGFARCEVVIVGGGIAGLSAAWRLVQAGVSDFVLLETEQILGGTACSGRSTTSAFPWGAHYLPAPRKENAPLVRLLDEMGVLEGRDAAGEPRVAEQHLCRDPDERLFAQGQWHEGLYPHELASAEDRRQLREFQEDVARWVAWRDGRGRRAFDLPIAAGSDDAELRALDQLSMAEYLDRRGWTAPYLRWYVEYACRDDYGLKLADTSAWAGLFYFASRVRGRDAAAQPLIVWPEGNGRIVDHLQRRVARQVRLGWQVTNIVPGDKEGEPAQVWAANRRGETCGFRTRRVIFAAPQFLAQFLIAPYREQRRPPAHLAVFDYGPWLVANLHLRDRPRERGFPLCWDNVFYDSPSLGYVVATHQTGSDFGPTVLTYYYAFCDSDAKAARKRLLDMPWQTCAELVLSDLERAHPDIRTLVTRLDVMKWGHAMTRPRVGSLWRPERAQARQPFRGIHFAHSDLSGLALFEEAFHHGLRAAEEALNGNG